jgi:tryptophan synthase alpha chain
MNRISECVRRLNGRKLLIPFFTVGYPSIKASRDLVMTAIEAGADMIELGMPFSDPLADGPAIQYSSHVALQNGVKMRSILDQAKAVRSQSDIPLILMGYYNPILAFGLERFLRKAKQVEVDGFIIPDLPVEDAEALMTYCARLDLSNIFLVAPTSVRQRMTAIDIASTDFVYAVTVAGVTGTGKRFGSDTARYLRQLRTKLSKPFVAGFGVDRPETARRMCCYADGVVIGSALVQLVKEAPNIRTARDRVGKFLRHTRQAI